MSGSDEAPLSPPWSGVWARLQPLLQARTTGVADDAWHALHVRTTPSFPFVATLSMGRGDPEGQETVSIGVSAYRDDGVIRLAADVADGDGKIVVKGPQTVLAAAEPGASLDAWVSDVEAFLQGPAVARALEAA